MEDLKTQTFASNPLSLTGNNLSVSLDKLNAELKSYNLRVNSLTDIYIDKELSAINPGDVLKIFTTRIEDSGEWTTNVEKWFQYGVKELEDKFEALTEIVSSAELDKGQLILTVYLNVKGVQLDKTLLESGGNADAEIWKKVDEQLTNRPDEVLKLVGINEGITEENKATAREKAFSLYKSQTKIPVYAFIHGRKIDLSAGATIDTIYLQSILHKKFYDYAADVLRSADNPKFCQNYANSKSVLGVDTLLGMAQKAQENGVPFYVTDEALDEVITRLCE